MQATDPDESAMTWSWTGYADSGIPYNGNAWSDSRMMWRDAAPFGATSATGWVKWDTNDPTIDLAIEGGVHGGSQKAGR